MANVSNELKIGLTILVATIVAFAGYRVMKDVPLFRSATVIYTTFEQVPGLLPGNPVNVRGYKIGSVKQMELLPSDSTRVTLNIENGHVIPKGSKAVLKSSGVLGGKFIEIQKSDAEQVIPHGGKIEGVFERGIMDSFAKEGEKLSGDISSSIQGLEEFLSNLNSTLDEENKKGISETIENVQLSTRSLEELLSKRQKDLDSAIVAAKNTMQHMDSLTGDNKEELAAIIQNLEATSQELETLSTGLNETNETLNQVLNKINNGEGSLGKMVNDPSLYNNIDSLSVNLNELIKNINDNPRRFLKHMRLVEVF